jgi:hypothetical protein
LSSAPSAEDEENNFAKGVDTEVILSTVDTFSLEFENDGTDVDSILNEAAV